MVFVTRSGARYVSVASNLKHVAEAVRPPALMAAAMGLGGRGKRAVLAFYDPMRNVLGFHRHARIAEEHRLANLALQGIMMFGPGIPNRPLKEWLRAQACCRVTFASDWLRTSFEWNVAMSRALIAFPLMISTWMLVLFLFPDGKDNSALAWADQGARPRVAGVATVYYHNSHADLLLSRMLEGYTLDSRGEYPPLRLASLFIDQFPPNDKGRKLASTHGVRLYPTITNALTLGGDELAVDGVFLIAEHGNYPESNTGQIIYPKRRMFGEIVRVCERSKRVVPVFVDKHLADNWTDAKWIYDEAKRLEMPLMAGSTLPVLWRQPPHDVDRDQPLSEIVALSYHRLDTYGIHALEIIQSLAERRWGGETGVKQVRTLRDADVWQAIREGRVNRHLLDKALASHKDRPIPTNQSLAELVPNPTLFLIEYRDGLRASVLTLGELYIDWTAAWSYVDGRTDAAVFWTQEARPFTHFAHLFRQLEPFFQTGKPTWSVERTVLTTGLLDALLISHREGGRWVETPHLAISYQTDWNWRQPSPPAPDRPLASQ